MFSKYYQLTKPGIIYGNLLTAAAGYILGAKGNINLPTMAVAMAGIAFVIGSACAINNVIDRNIDKKMTRTQKRAIVTKAIPVKRALAFAIILGFLGFGLLAEFSNLATFILVLVGFIDYLGPYSWAKRHSVHSTLVGSISGAVPIAAGYTAATGMFDGGALLLFLLMVCWQMPHFYSIALFRNNDYLNAGLPVLAVKKGPQNTRRQILAYIALFIITSLLLFSNHYINVLSEAIIIGLAAYWLGKGIRPIQHSGDLVWGKTMFGLSLIVLCGLSLAIVISGLAY